MYGKGFDFPNFNKHDESSIIKSFWFEMPNAYALSCAYVHLICDWSTVMLNLYFSYSNINMFFLHWSSVEPHIYLYLTSERQMVRRIHKSEPTRLGLNYSELILLIYDWPCFNHEVKFIFKHDNTPFNPCCWPSYYLASQYNSFMIALLLLPPFQSVCLVLTWHKV